MTIIPVGFQTVIYDYEFCKSSLLTIALSGTSFSSGMGFKTDLTQTRDFNPSLAVRDNWRSRGIV